MIVLSKKDYEIEETVQINKQEDKETKTLYEFKMQITSEELGKIKDLIFSDENQKAQKQIQKLKYENKYDEAEKIETEIGNKILTQEEDLKLIIFKDSFDKVKELTNDYEFEKLYSEIIAFFINAFVKEKITPLNTTLTDLQKITQK